jgi:exportin-7
MFRLLLAATALGAAQAAYCNGSPASGLRTNENPIFDGMGESMRFLRKTKNAVLFETGPENATFHVVHLYGSPYELGVAQGTILKREVNAFYSKTWSYLVGLAVNELGDKIPPLVQAKIISLGFEKALDWCAR